MNKKENILYRSPEIVAVYLSEENIICSSTRATHDNFEHDDNDEYEI